nr:hypothetical protein [uncultured bacterium]
MTGRMKMTGVAAAAALLLGAAPAGRGDAWTGSFALRLELASTTRIPLLGGQRSVTTSLLLVDVERAGGGWTQRHRVCDVRVTGSSLARMTVPAAFVRGLPVRRYPAVLREAEGAVRYTADMGVEAIGYDPVVTRGALPSRAADPGVRDPDGDGRPGATVELRVPAARARLFIVQRSHLVLSGREVSPDRIEGGVRVLAHEQRTLGAEPGFFARTPVIRPDPGRSGFVLARAPGVRSCQDLVRAAPGLFPGR